MKKTNRSNQATLSKPIIRKLVNTWKKEKKNFKNPTQLIDVLHEELKILEDSQPSTASIRRYLKQMGFFFRTSENYGFSKNTYRFDKFITYIGLYNHICFFLEEPSMGMFIAKKINDYYSSYKIGLEYYVYCIAIENLLICFYDDCEEMGLDESRLMDEIPKILKHYYLDNDNQKKT